MWTFFQHLNTGGNNSIIQHEIQNYVSKMDELFQNGSLSLPAELIKKPRVIYLYCINMISNKYSLHSMLEFFLENCTSIFYHLSRCVFATANHLKAEHDIL